MNKNLPFKLLFKLQLYISLNTLFFMLLFKHLGSIYTSLVLNPSTQILQDIDETSVVKLQSTIRKTLIDQSFDSVLYKYSIFFYLDDFSKRVSFLNYPVENKVNNKSQIIKHDVFYEEMLTNHKEDICFVKNTTLIPKSSDIYVRLKIKGDITQQNYYISCPLFLNNSLVGYLGGLYKNTSLPIYVSILPIKNAATVIESVLLKN